jgi:hypothetical protein
MEIKLQTSRTILDVNGERLVRTQLDDGTIFWGNLTTNRLYKLELGNWTECEAWNRNSLISISYVPTWEQEYQETLLAQYPFEKRVREIVENNVDVGSVMFKLARDFDFVQLVKEYLKKLPR